MQAEVRTLMRSAARPYLAAGLYAYFFARGKTGCDPVYVSLLRSGVIPDGARMPHHHRSLAEWAAMLHRLGFAVEAEPMSAGTPFANVLLTAQCRHQARTAVTGQESLTLRTPR